jgi:hypothetical protein
MKTMMLEGKTAHHGGDVCVMCVSLAKSLLREFFVPAEMHLAVKLLNTAVLEGIHIKFKTPSSPKNISFSNTRKHRCSLQMLFM